MATNFNILIHRNSDCLHLKLTGDFDGSSAWELINAMKTNNNRVQKIFVHTNCLKNIYPFGRDTFQKNLCDLRGYPNRIIFTGENAEQIAPEKSLCL